MSKIYEIHLRSLLDLLTTHYAVGYTPGNAGGPLTGVTSSDKVYTDPAEFVQLIDIVQQLLYDGDYQHSPYSDLRQENDVLYVPVVTADSVVRFGPALYDLKSGNFLFDTSRAGSQSPVILDYSKYLGRQMTAEEKDDLAFILNIYRTGRSPLFELEVLKKSDDVADLLSGKRPHVSQIDIDAYTTQLARIAGMWGASSKIVPSPSIPVNVTATEKLSPLLTILADFLNHAGVNTSTSRVTADKSAFVYDPDTYREWKSEILDSISPAGVMDFMTEFGSPAIYVFQFIANHPGMINKVIETGAVSATVDGNPAEHEVPSIYQARNTGLLQFAEETTGLVSGDVTVMEACLGDMGNTTLNTIANEHFQLSSSMRAYKKSQSDGEDFAGDVEKAMSGKSSNIADHIVQDMRTSFDIANTGLVPLSELNSVDNVRPFVEGLGLHELPALTGGGRDESPLTYLSQRLVKSEEESLRHTEFLVRVTNQSEGRDVTTDLRDLSAFTVSDSSFSRNSTSSLYAKAYDDPNHYMIQYSSGWTDSHHYLSVIDGKDVGAVNPLTNTSVAELTSRSYGETQTTGLAKLAAETTAQSKGSWYKLDLDTVRATRIALERVLGRLERETR